MTPLRKRMLQDMELRNFAEITKETYVRCVRKLAEFYDRSPAELNEEEVRNYLLYLREERRVKNGTYIQHLCAIRFLYRHTLGNNSSGTTTVRFGGRPHQISC